jgi:pimeloyl-ACP methyl ester carboxylesterase
MKKCCKVLLKIVKWFFIIVIAVVILFLIVRFIGQRINNKTPEGGINEQMYVDINGTKQWISIYGQNKDNPVLLWLQAGPGEQTSTFNYAYTRKWSDVYTVVTWDKRDTGKTYCYDQNVTDLTLDLLIEDGIEMTEFLREYLGKEKITLMGHSWGSTFGCKLVLAHPEYYDCYIGAAQYTDWTRMHQAFAEAAAQWVGDDPEGKALLEQLDTDLYTDSYSQAHNALLEKYGYAPYQDKCDYSQLSAIIFNPYYSLADYVKLCSMDTSALDHNDDK